MKILDKTYEIIDSLEYITLADSFVLNKIGTGHGEAKLYVGNVTNERLLRFFEGETFTGFCLKTDFISFLNDAKDEYNNPQQEYIKKHEMLTIYSTLKDELNNFTENLLEFNFKKVNIAPPRIYINDIGNSVPYRYIRKLGLPSISYLSILKLKDNSSNEIKYYFKMFIDYKPDIIGYLMPEEKIEEERIKHNSTLKKTQKETLINSRIGQGKYRDQLLEESSLCPFTLINDERLLIASHIKPWSKSTDKEKIDPKNGFLFTPTFDKLFDKGFISFSDEKELIVSPWISPLNQKRLGIFEGKIIEKLIIDEKRKKYLEYHRENILKK